MSATSSRLDDLATPARVSGILTPRRIPVKLPVRGLRAVISVDRQLVDDLLAHDPAWRLEGKRVNDLSPLWPYQHARRVLLRAAQRMTRDLARQGKTLLTTEADVRVWGPFESPNWSRARDNALARGLVARGRAAGEEYGGDVYDFLFVADFLADHAVLTDTTPQRPHVLAS